MKICLIIFLIHIAMITNGQWLKLDPPNSKNVKIEFIDENTGFIASKYNLHKSTDGGRTWSFVDIPGAEPRKNDVIMINENIVWCATDSMTNTVNYGGILFKSEDGGTSWDMKLQHNIYPFRSLFFVGESYGWLGTYLYSIYFTTDGGDSWTLVDDLPMEQVRNFYFIDKDTGWICGDIPGIISKTTDGGMTWETQLDEGYSERFRDIEFLNGQKGFVGGLDRTFLVTNNGGESWEYIASTENEGVLVGLPPDYGIYDIEFIDENKGWITGGPC